MSQRASTKSETTDFCEFKMKFEPSEKNSQKTKRSMLTFEDRGGAEMWCEW
jgi:hypothetical protein